MVTGTGLRSTGRDDLVSTGLGVGVRTVENAKIRVLTVFLETLARIAAGIFPPAALMRFPLVGNSYQ